MSVKLEFDSVAQRKDIHHIIRESAREISEHTKLLETLFLLENGKERQDGFGYVSKNTPKSETVMFHMSEEEFESHLEILTSTTINDFDETDDKYENQLKSIISQLQESAEIMKNKTR